MMSFVEELEILGSRIDELGDDAGSAAGADVNPERETREAVGRILDVAMTPMNVVKQLHEMLNVLMEISWLRVKNKGAIFVANGRRELVMVAQKGLDGALHATCAKIRFGQCLCGQAAQEKRIIMKNCVDHDHHITFEGMTDHGHYCVPLLDNQDEIIGVMVLYLKAGHQGSEEEQSLMKMLGRVASGVLLNRTLGLRAQINRIRLEHAQFDVIHKLVAASEYRDNETGEHIKRMARYSVVLGRGLGLSRSELKTLEMAAPLHDIGKIGVPDRILLKQGKLTDEERGEMQSHTTIGSGILVGIHPLLVTGRQIAVSHHEKWDGTGYPNGLKGEDIPLAGRICALADVFDALTSARPYKEAWPFDKAVAWIVDKSGTHFDPAVVRAFVDGLDEIREIYLIYGEGHADEDCTRLPDTIQVQEPVMCWDESMSVGVASIDKQHQFLINLINRVHYAIEAYRPRDIVDALLAMKSYAEVHFDEEEKLMEEAGYPDLEKHRRIHHSFFHKTESFLSELEESPLAICTETGHYLTRWLMDHIKGEDRGYIPYVLSRAQDVEPVST